MKQLSEKKINALLAKRITYKQLSPRLKQKTKLAAFCLSPEIVGKHPNHYSLDGYHPHCYVETIEDWYDLYLENIEFETPVTEQSLDEMFDAEIDAFLDEEN